MKRFAVVIMSMLAPGCGLLGVPEACTTEPESDCDALRLASACIAAVTPSYRAGGWESLTLERIPDELALVLANPSEFSTDDHPLTGVEPGSAGDSLDGLSGCWGRFMSRGYSDSSGQWLEAEALVIDLDGRTLTSQTMLGVEGHPCASDQRPMITVTRHEIHATMVDRLDLQIVEGTPWDRSSTGEAATAGLEPDGRLTFHLLARFVWEVSVGNRYEKLATLSGDSLATTASNGDAIVPPNDLWTRFVCPD